jgi:hypothetical protein
VAKKDGVNKTKAVLDYLKQHPKAKSPEIAEALTKAGVPIKAGHVANIKSKHKKQRRAVKTVVAKTGVGIPEVKSALALLKVCGSISAAKEALSAAQEIKAMM